MRYETDPRYTSVNRPRRGRCDSPERRALREVE